MRTVPPTKRTVEEMLLPEYRFDYSQAKPNWFARRIKPNLVAVLLEPDVAKAFTTPEP
jgi:hypothetical protein